VHVCFLNRSYWPDVSATGQLLTELAEDLVRIHGWEVTVVSGYPLKTTDAVPRTEVRNGVRIARAAGSTRDPRRFVGRALNYLTYFASAVVHAQMVSRPDVIVALTDPPVIGLAAWAASVRFGVPFVFLCEDVFPEVAVLVEDFRSPTVNAVLDRVNRFLVRRARRIVALGETMERRLVEGKGAPPEAIRIIHNWADCSAVVPGARDNPFARRHGLVDAFVVLHAGNIGLSQDLEIVLRAAERLRHRPDIVFLFVGDGAKRPALESMAHARGLTNVRFLPFQPRAEMGQSYATADVALISLRRGLAGVIVPSKLYPILASGRACVAAVEADCEVAAIVQASGCGHVVEPGDDAALAARIVEMADDPDRTRLMGHRAREVAEQFDRPRQVAAYAAVLKEAAC
jgi:glycosyltransferase involved in cell wall biosynthesis